jgi:pantoate--beta-alanine ligase
MILVKKVSDLKDLLQHEKSKSSQTGFVPTMGALHDGHLSLLSRSVKENQKSVCSIFINPTQFNDVKDFEKYPVTLERDIPLLEKNGCDILFLPSVKEIYPDGLTSAVHYNLGFLETILEGKYRPGHFQGVCQVMHRLLDIVRPDNLYMGRKDYQQCMVVNRLIELSGFDTKLHLCPTLREADGLAMSSRNLRLQPDDRQKASTLFHALSYLKAQLKPGSLEMIRKNAMAMLDEKGFKTDYLAIADANTLEPTDHWDGSQNLVALVAAVINDVRLIDNMLITG